MKELNNIVEKKEIVGVAICIIIIVISCTALFRMDLNYVFKGPKEINNIVELEKVAENTLVKVKFNRVYETDYQYYIDYVPVARFLDLEINGKALIAIVDNDVAESILNGETNYIEGALKTFTEENMLEGLNHIKQNYLEDLGNDLSEDEILDIFTKMQLLNYGLENRPSLIISTILIILIIFALVYGILIIFRKIRTQR